MLNSVLTAFSGGGRVTANPKACTRAGRVAASRSECRLCADVCPEDAIRLGGPCEMDDARCTGCAFCVAVCPGAAFAGSAPARKELAEFWKNAAGQREGALSCSRAISPPAVPALTRRCLASFVWEHPAVAVLAGARNVSMIRGDCAGCPDGEKAGPLIKAHFEMARRFAAAGGLGEISLTDAPGIPSTGGDRTPAGRDMSRREMFGLFFDRGRDAAAAAGDELANRFGGVFDGPGNPGAPWEREVLGALLRDRGARGEVPGGRFAKRPVVSAERCTFCGICAAACPTGALSVPRGGDRASVVLAAHRCTACGVCAKACRESALNLKSKIEIAEWGVPTAFVIASAEGTRCRGCGRFVSGGDHRCNSRSPGQVRATPKGAEAPVLPV